MGVLTFIFHLFHFFLPAWAMAALLAPAVLGWRAFSWSGACGRRVVRLWAGLALAGSLVLVGGLLCLGRDGKMATYVALVLVMGSVAAWQRGRR